MGEAGPPWLAPSAAQAQGTTLISNRVQASGGETAPVSNTLRNSTAVTTGANAGGYELSGVTFNITSGSNISGVRPSVAVSVYETDLLI